jgi:myo-inositol 2-dehydrogenase/D-chiro-inositol 1-dehydrogenase
VSADVVRIGVIGAGRMGRVHLDALALSESAMAVAVVDPVPAAREAVAARVVSTYATVEQLLERGGFDAVLVAAPTDLHRDLVVRLAQAGIPVLSEKPCGLRPADARVAADAAREAGTVLQIGYWRRFVPELVALRERLASGELGEPSLVICHQWDHELPSAQFRAHSGGIAVDMGVHEIDQVRWLLGAEFEDVVGVPAGSSAGEASAADPDCAAVLARLSDGTAATITLGRHFPPGDSCWLELFARRGYERALFMWGDDADRAFHAGLAAQADAFAATVRGEAQRGATGEDAVAALAVAERIAARERVGSAGGASGVRPRSADGGGT